MIRFGRRRDFPASIEVYEDGPYLLRGAYSLLDAEGLEIDPRRCTIALCACGRSKIKPFCDGSHSVVREPGSVVREPGAVTPRDPGHSRNGGATPGPGSRVA